MITPDELAARILPPAGTGRTYAAQLTLADSGMALAEHMLDAVPRGRHLDAALADLVRSLHSAYAGMDPACVSPGHEPVPDAPGGDPVPGHPDPDADPLVLDVAMWRFGITTSSLHPLTRLVGLVLAEVCGPSGYIPDAAQPTLTQLADRTGLHLHPLHHHLSDLVAARWISRHSSTESGIRRTRYQLRLPNPLTR